MNEQTVQILQGAMGHVRRGEMAAAQALVDQGLSEGVDPLPLHEFMGIALCRAGNFAEGAAHLRRAYDLAPPHPDRARMVMTALIDASDWAGALSVATDAMLDADASGRLARLRAFALQQLERHDEAAQAYRQILARTPDDFEAWNNLGNAEASRGDYAASVVALKEALKRQPDNGPVALNCAVSLAEAGEVAEAETLLEAFLQRHPADCHALVELAGIKKLLGNEGEAIACLERAVTAEPDNADLWLKLGTEHQALLQTEPADRALQTALRLNPGLGDAYLLRALLLEHTNREEELTALVAAAERHVADQNILRFLRAMVLWRDKDYAAGLDMIQSVDPALDPVRTAQLTGQFMDRLGAADPAFAQFSRVNELHRASPEKPVEKASQFRAQLAENHALTTADWVSSWQPVPGDDGPAPVFLVGFPRSGTTLLDTLLMGHAEVEVMEERPTIHAVEAALGSWDRLAGLSAEEIGQLRQVYRDEARRWTPCAPGRLLVDKSPLYMNKLPVILRLFPEARFILALRHPMDVLLSCYVTNFRLNSAMSNFLSLEGAAGLYDASFSFWTHCAQLFAPPVFQVRYEDMVADKAATIRPLFDWLGLSWQEAVLDHQKTALSRGIITTASYAQVTEPIYTRSRGRWEAYRTQMAPILPIIRPWAERFGYEL
ncbi:MAG: sulfotransferase [Chakrabartia sp.]